MLGTTNAKVALLRSDLFLFSFFVVVNVLGQAFVFTHENQVSGHRVVNRGCLF